MLTEFGEGVILYFWLLRSVSILLIVLTLLYIPSMYIFASGGYDSDSLVNVGTLAGLGPVWDIQGVSVTYDDVNAFYGSSTGSGISSLRRELSAAPAG
jgi:hypothetical protein